MNGFEALLKKINNKKNQEKNELNNLRILEIENNVDNALNDLTEDFFLLNKNNYSFRLYITKKKLPVQSPSATNKLDYDINDFYFLTIAINDSSSLCEVTIDRFDCLDSVIEIFNKWKHLLENETEENIFNNVIELIP